LSPPDLRKIDAYWRACKYLALGMIYLQANPLLKEPLKPEQIKNRLLGHWGSSPGLAFLYIHLNRLIKKYDLDMIFMAGPGHGAPGYWAQDVSKEPTPRFTRKRVKTKTVSANSLSSSRFPAASAVIAPPKLPVRSTKAASWDMCSLTPAALPSTTLS